MSSWKEVSYRAARRVVVIVVGTTLALVGVVLVFLPGPAVVVWGIALAVFAVEFTWARRWLRRLKESAEQSANAIGIRLPGSSEDGERGESPSNGTPRRSRPDPARSRDRSSSCLP